jgi:hypothetical protein
MVELLGDKPRHPIQPALDALSCQIPVDSLPYQNALDSPCSARNWVTYGIRTPSVKQPAVESVARISRSPTGTPFVEVTSNQRPPTELR